MAHGMREAVIREQEAESLMRHKRGRGGKVKDTRAKALSAFNKRQAYLNASLPARALATVLAIIATAALGLLALAFIGAVAWLALPARYASAVCLTALFLIVFDLYRITRRRARGKAAKESRK